MLSEKALLACSALRRDARPPRAFWHDATGASLGWADIAHGECAWQESRRQLSDDGQRRVGLLLDEPLATVALLGALGAGVGVAPLNPGASAAELVAQCRALGVQALVTDVDDDVVIDSLGQAGVDLWWRSGRRLVQRFSAMGPRPALPAGVAALVLATSG